MNKIVFSYLKFPYSLPITSGILLVFSFPPFNLWYLGFVALVPFYFFLIEERSLSKICKGGIILGFISQYPILTLLGSFHWLPEAYLFSNLLVIFYMLVVILSSILIGLTSILVALLIRKSRAPIERVLMMGLFALTEFIIGIVYLGQSYNSFAYIGVHLYLFRIIASVGGMILLSLVIVFSNAAIGELLFFFKKKNERGIFYAITPIVLLALILLTSLYVIPIKNTLVKNNTPAVNKTLSIATIQDMSNKENTAFGLTTNKRFHFPLLRQHIREARMLNPDVIIYPFSPWNGAISSRVDNQFFNKKVIVTSFDAFGAWLEPQLPPDTIFITWGTVLRNGLYLNEIEFWKNGKLIGTYDKRRAFPFMDNTPLWAQRLGIYSIQFDITEGTSTAPVNVDGVRAGSLACSEVMYSSVSMENAKNSDILFSLGSEGMFSNAIASEFNLMNAQLRAVETGRPIIRSDKLGPSAFINKYGDIDKKMPYGRNGILFGKVSVQLNAYENPYNNNTRYALILLFIGYMLFVWFRKRK